MVFENILDGELVLKSVIGANGFLKVHVLASRDMRLQSIMLALGLHCWQAAGCTYLSRSDSHLLNQSGCTARRLCDQVMITCDEDPGLHCPSRAGTTATIIQNPDLQGTCHALLAHSSVTAVVNSLWLLTSDRITGLDTGFSPMLHLG